MDDQQKQNPQPSQRKNALVRYVAILFAVAFLLVLLSYLIQVRNMSATVSELNQTSSSALSNAQMLQTMNQQLMEENESLRNDLDALEAELEAEQESAAKQAADAEELYASAMTEAADALTAAEQAHADTLAVYELLSKASNAANANDLVALRSYLSELEPSAPLLGQNGLRLYQALQEVATAASAETGAE